MASLRKPELLQPEDVGGMNEPGKPPTGDDPISQTEAMQLLANMNTRRAEALRVVRDTFSMPRGDYDLIEMLRTRAARGGRNTTKSEVIRAGLHALLTLSRTNLVDTLDGLQKVKPGRK